MPNWGQFSGNAPPAQNQYADAARADLSQASDDPLNPRFGIDEERKLRDRTILPEAAQRTQYAMNPRNSGLEQASQRNPVTGEMMNLAGQQPGAPGTALALKAAGQLGGAGQFMSQINRTGQQFAQDNAGLRDMAAGRGPSAATALMQSSLDANARGAHSLAAGARGGNLAGGLRAAIGAGTAANQQAIQQGAAMRANEQISAMGQLAGANANLMSGQTAAQQAESARQAAASGAGANAAQTAIAGQQAQGQILQGAGNLYNAGMSNAIGAQGVQAGVARDAAADMEAQRQRALQAYQVMVGDRNQRTANDNNRFATKQAGKITPAGVAGAVTGLAGAGIAAAIPGK